MQSELQAMLKKAEQDLFGETIDIELTRPEEKYGDFSTNLALQLAAKLGKNPREIAEALSQKLGADPAVSEVSVAGPGFINIKLTDEQIAQAAAKATNLPTSNDEQTIVLEHTDPNPFKEFHIGHAYSNTVGVAIGKLLQQSGAKVHQVTYQGDVGLHIAMAVWAIGEEINWQQQTTSDLKKLLGSRIGTYYAKGSKAYEEEPDAKAKIEDINQHLYKKDDQLINAIYEAGREVSLQHFEEIYKLLGANFEKNYFESETAEEGVKVVKQNTPKVFTPSEGAIIYNGEKVGLHKRVFITKQGLPTYEAKEIGLAFAKARDYPDAQAFIVITGNEIDDYFRVLLAAIAEIDKGLSGKINHLSHGMVRFAGGKMSSRTGNVKLFSVLERDVTAAIKKLHGHSQAQPAVVLGAIKYEFLKHRVGGDFIFDVEQSISLEGNSGPYLQYAHARAASILAKAPSPGSTQASDLDQNERSLARKISEYPEVVNKALTELMPHHLCTYLYELAQNFNRFYEKSRVIGDERQAFRLGLIKAYKDVLKNGLDILNIDAPQKL